MGMTIDDHIEVLKSYHHGFTGCAGNLQDSIDVAVDIMRKYQKIAEIVMNGDDTHYKLLMQIKEVIEDGNDR
jgi:hypothetical protein